MRVRIPIALACLLACGVAPAADQPWGRAGADSDDFTVLLLLTPDPQAVAKMWAKPAPPNLQEYRTAEIGTGVTAMFAVSGGRADAEGRCNLVYRLAIAHADGSPGPQSSPETLCAQRAPGPRGAMSLGESAATVVTDGDPRTITVVATVTDRTTGKSVDVSAPLQLVTPGTLFHFESMHSLDDMSAWIRKRFTLGSERAGMRRVFVTDGRAQLFTHPTRPGVEKYVYDIDLCGYYVWRWNISADFDDRGLLRQAYVNGDIVFPDGSPKRIVAKGPSAPGKTASIYRATRPRPEASKGESSLAYMLFDGDSDENTLDDRAAVGAGPTQPDPVDMGRLYVYSDVDPWRSIFDRDRAEPIAQYSGSCAKVDAYFDAHPEQRDARRLTTKSVVDRLEKAMQSASSSTAQGKPAP